MQQSILKNSALTNMQQSILKNSVLTNAINVLAQEIIVFQQDYIAHLGFVAHVHFELEGCFESAKSLFSAAVARASNNYNFDDINAELAAMNIDGGLVTEYWQNQWEFVSHFNGQSPLKEAQNLQCVINKLPQLAKKYGFNETYIQPVVWSGDRGKLAKHCDNVFSTDSRAVHIPNAIQLNVSVSKLELVDSQYKATDNIVAYGHFGEQLQQCFLQTSGACSLLYLPEEDAFERFALKSKYGLARELCSPTDISGGHQGSIALYRKQGKHNQLMGETPLLYGSDNQIMISEYHWQKTARIEHRLGASSYHYNPYVNVIFALANVIDALEDCYDKTKAPKNESVKIQELPLSLYNRDEKQGAIALFTQDNWFEKSINQTQQKMLSLQSNKINSAYLYTALGSEIKKQILATYGGFYPSMNRN